MLLCKYHTIMQVLYQKITNTLHAKNLNKINTLVIIFNCKREISRNDPKYTNYIFQDYQRI